MEKLLKIDLKRILHSRRFCILILVEIAVVVLSYVWNTYPYGQTLWNVAKQPFAAAPEFHVSWLEAYYPFTWYDKWIGAGMGDSILDHFYFIAMPLCAAFAMGDYVTKDHTTGYVKQVFLHVGRKAAKIVAEIALDVLRVCQERIEGKLAGIVKLIAGGLREEAVLHGEVFDLLILREHGVMRRQQAVVKALYDRHGQDHKPVFVRLKRSAQHVRHVPDHRGFLCNIRSDYCDFIVRHGMIPLSSSILQSSIYHI